MNKQQCIGFVLLISVVFLFQCGGDTESTKLSSTDNKATIEEQPYHDPLKVGYPIDIEKTDVVKQVEEMLAANIALADTYSENEINEQVDSLFQQVTSTPGVEPVPIKDENEMKLVRKYFREYLLTNYILHKCQLNNMITSPDRQRLAEKYCRFMVVYYNNAYGLSLPLGPEKP